MSRSRFAPAALGLALCAVLGAGCGSRDATQNGTRDDVADQLTDQGIDTEPAGEVADCIARGLFESQEFTKDERNEVLRANDADEPPAELVARVEDLVEGCAEEAGVLEEIRALDVVGGASASGSDDASTTTERQSAGDDETTTTTE